MKEDTIGKGGKSKNIMDDAIGHEEGEIFDMISLQLFQIGEGKIIKAMEANSGTTPCFSPLLLGNGSPLIDDTLMVSLPGIVEMLSPIIELQNLDLLNNEVD